MCLRKVAQLIFRRRFNTPPAGAPNAMIEAPRFNLHDFIETVSRNESLKTSIKAAMFFLAAMSVQTYFVFEQIVGVRKDLVSMQKDLFSMREDVGGKVTKLREDLFPIIHGAKIDTATKPKGQ